MFEHENRPNRSEPSDHQPEGTLDLVDLGIIDYEKGLECQLEHHCLVQSGEKDRILFCSHWPVVTLGRGATPLDYAQWKGQIVKVSRGGKATYHGPSQVVAYPIINIDRPGKCRRARDVKQVLSLIETAIVKVLVRVGIDGRGRSGEYILRGQESLEATGVWVGDKKIASIGIAVKNWITYHGLALNLNYDREAFSGMNPCGFPSSVMTSIEEQLGQRVPRERVITELKLELEQFLV